MKQLPAMVVRGAALMCLAFFTILPLHGQRSMLEFQTGSIALGEIRQWNTQPAVFHVTNAGTTRVAILRADPNPEVKVQLPQGFIDPGETDSVVVWLFPKKTGKHHATVKLYPSDVAAPVVLKVSGDVIRLDPCPGMEDPDPPKEVVVQDALTGEKMPGVEVTLIREEQMRFQGKTGREGSFEKNLKGGLYQVVIFHPGYQPLNVMQYLHQNARRMVFRLMPDTVVQPEEPLPPSQYAWNNIVFLIDASSSMRHPERMPLLKTGIKSLITILRPNDIVSLITYADEPTLILSGIPGDQRELLMNAIDSIQPYGLTYGVQGIRKAYETTLENFIPSGNNQLIIATDGEFTDAGFTEVELHRMITQYRRQGVKLSLIGFGNNKEAKRRMKRMSAKGDGSYLHIDAGSDIRHLLTDEIRKQSGRKV